MNGREWIRVEASGREGKSGRRTKRDVDRQRRRERKNTVE